MLMRKPRSYAEVYNDLDGEIVNVFRVVRYRGDELRRALELTPFAREEFLLSYEPSDDPVEQARRTIARSFMGFGSAAACGEVSGFRANSNRLGTTPAQDWRNYPDSLPPQSTVYAAWSSRIATPRRSCANTTGRTPCTMSIRHTTTTHERVATEIQSNPISTK